MTVQFILPEATSFPKERKLHDRLFLVLLYNLLCKTFKDHSDTFAASSRTGAHPSLARALLPDCECKGRAFLHSLQDFHKKKCEKNPFMPILPLHSMAKPPYNPFFHPHSSAQITPLPHSTQKIQADFLSKRLHFSPLPPLFLSKPPHLAQTPFDPTHRTRAHTHIHACALSEFAIFAFTLHLTPQQPVDQSLECEGKPCLHLHRNNLNFNT